MSKYWLYTESLNDLKRPVPALIVKKCDGNIVLPLRRFYDIWKLGIVFKMIGNRSNFSVGAVDIDSRKWFQVDTDDITMDDHYKLEAGDHQPDTLKRVLFTLQQIKGHEVYFSKQQNADGSPRFILTTENQDLEDELQIAALLAPGAIVQPVLPVSAKVTRWSQILTKPLTFNQKCSPFCEYLPDTSVSSLTKMVDYMYQLMWLLPAVVDKGMTVQVFIENVDDLMAVLANGWYPYVGEIALDSRVIDMKLQGMSDDVARFWYGQALSTTGMYFRSKTLNKLIKEAVDNCQSNTLKYISPDLLYTSMRPRTDMAMFRLPQSLTVDEPSNFINVEGENFQLIPVTRYATGMSKGLYYCTAGSDETATCNLEDSEDDEYCGTFYYYEPQSTCFLAVKTERVRVYRNKLEAYLRLLGVNKLRYFNKLNYLSPLVYAQLLGAIPDDLLMTASDLFKIVSNKWVIPLNDMSDPMPENLSDWSKRFHTMISSTEPSTKFGLTVVEAAREAQSSNFRGYAGVILGLYASEDSLDQPICEAARDQGIDVVHLTHMIGSHQVVHEILDTRPRMSSFKSLVYKK